jgi:dihydrofolate synthase/folylpolyglutamate synthase
MKFGLENMKKVCAALDHPERHFRSVIVAGTNGKGSVTAMTSAALHAAGHRSARYTSPHLERLEERFVIDEREVGSGELEASAGIVRDAVEGLLRDGVLEALPTFFECATAIAFDLFRRAAVEVAVIEVGLGGRLDATNVITPMAAAITSIDFDHQELLGDTLETIAREKAGVIKTGIPVVAGPLPKEAADAIEDVCRERGARYVRALDRVRVSAELHGDRMLQTFETSRGMLADVALALKGQHQSVNAAVVLALLEELDGLGMSVPDAAARAGLERTRWPGRLETVHWRGADVLLDAAHNPAGARALALYLRESGWTGSTLVLGVMRDKDARNMLQPLLPVAGQVICTTPPSPRALPAAELADIALTLPGAEQMHMRVLADPADAIRTACRDARHVVAAGSIFLIGPLRGILR